MDEGLKLSVSATTRLMRDGEEDGEDYIFMTPDAFQKDVDNGLFLEHVENFGHCYGTPKRPVAKSLDDGFDVLLDVDWRGAQSVVSEWPGRAVRIFILPPSLEVLAERLLRRGGDIQRRLAQAEEDMAHWVEYDYVVINDQLSVALDDLVSIIRAERLKVERFHTYV